VYHHHKCSKKLKKMAGAIKVVKTEKFIPQKDYSMAMMMAT
jgi:hypothetical protein